MTLPVHTASEESASKKRRLDSEMVMLQSDRSKLLRSKEAADLEKRTLEHALRLKEEELSRKDEESKKLAFEIQQLDSELIRLKRQRNALP